MTLGKGILNGQVPYRDLFEQKGPLIYFIHAAGALVSDNSFIGVFFIQFIFLIVHVIYMKKIACLFLPEKISYLIAILTTAVILTAKCFSSGDNVEEYTATLITVSIYYTLYQYMKKSSSVSNWIILLNGVFIGFALWTKFTLLGYWVGWTLFTLVPFLIHKEYKRFFSSILIILGGITIVSIPVIIYFGVNSALVDLFYTYFYCNIFLYSQSGNPFIKIFFAVVPIFSNIWNNTIYTILIALGLFNFFLTGKYIQSKVCRLSLLSSLILAHLSIYIGGFWYRYYAFIFASFTIFGVIALYDIIKTFIQKKVIVVLSNKVRDAIYYGAILLVVITSVIASNCLTYISMDRLEFPQYKFAEIIKQKENATLLNYGFLDGGFYFAAGVQPINKYFHEVNIPKKALPEMYEEQLMLIRNKSVDFVVTRVEMTDDTNQIDCPELYQNYTLISYADDTHDDDYRYYLYGKK